MATDVNADQAADVTAEKAADVTNDIVANVKFQVSLLNDFDFI